MNFTNLESITLKTFKHENLHVLGATHQAIGGVNDKFHSVNERVIGAAFNVASTRIPNLSIKTSNFKKGDSLTNKNVGAINVPKVTASSDRPNSGANAVKLNGTIIQLAQ